MQDDSVGTGPHSAPSLSHEYGVNSLVEEEPGKRLLGAAVGAEQSGYDVDVRQPGYDVDCETWGRIHDFG